MLNKYNIIRTALWIFGCVLRTAPFIQDPPLTTWWRHLHILRAPPLALIEMKHPQPDTRASILRLCFTTNRNMYA